jgi:hypothetical protein
VRSEREAALQQLDTGADKWSAGTQEVSGDSPNAQLSVASASSSTAADLASLAQEADPSQTQDETSLKAKVEKGKAAWAKLQQLHEVTGSRGRNAKRASWMEPRAYHRLNSIRFD